MATEEERAPDGAVALMRMVDFRIPLPWLLGGFIVSCGSLIGMYYQLQAVSEKLVALQIDVKAGNGLMSAMMTWIASKTQLFAGIFK